MDNESLIENRREYEVRILFKEKNWKKRAAAVIALIGIITSCNRMDIYAENSDSSQIKNNTPGVEYDMDESAGNPINSSSRYEAEQVMAKAFDVNLDIQVSSTFRKGPFDILLVLDYSGSMAADMNGDILYCGDKSSEDDPDYVAKNNEASRYRIMREAVREFLEKLEDTASGDTKIGIIAYSDVIYTKEFSLLSATKTEELTGWMDDQPVEGGTYTDQAMVAAYEMFAQLPEPEAEGQRNIVFFTDGEPGATGFQQYTDEEGNFVLSEGNAVSYRNNVFRMMAEVMNQAAVLKGAYGDEVETNQSMTAIAPQVRNPWMDEEIPELYQYYGVSVKPDVFEQYDSYDPQELTELYEKAGECGQLSTWWQSLSNWDLLSSLDWDLRSEYRGDYSAENYASAKHGNYMRSKEGMGVKVHSVGLFNEAEYRGEKIEYIRHYLEQVSSDGKYAIATEAAELVEAFEDIFEEIVGEFQGYMLFDLGEEYIAYHADGSKISQESSDLIWIEDQTLWIGPLDVVSQQNLMAITLISRDNSLEEFTYEREAEEHDIPEILTCFHFQQAGDEPEEDLVYIKSLEITEKK